MLLLSVFVVGLASISAIPAVPATLEPCLYPRESETRELKSLDGIWRFVRSDPADPNEGVRDRWYDADLDDLAGAHQRTIPMPVPASYNDITTDRELRDHVGPVWYDRRFFVPAEWLSLSPSKPQRRVWLRFGSVHYAARVWLNGRLVAQHQIGHLPFQADVTDAVIFGAENRVTVLCDNVLRATTVPQGDVVNLPSDNGTTLIQDYTFDFFNYAGIHRSVHLYTTPSVYVKSVIFTTSIVNDTTGTINFVVEAANALSPALPAMIVRVYDKAKVLVAKVMVNASHSHIDNSGPSITTTTYRGQAEIADANLWWPYLMHPEPGYLYTVQLSLIDGANGDVIDVYRQAVGIRTLRWTNKQFLLNDRPVYMRGFGRHEDADIRGKGLDLVLLTRDFNLLHWIGANAYRTSHYPYSEESMQFADEAGIMVIAECPSVDTDRLSAELKRVHRQALDELIVRDRNHAAVVMWSISNEARSAQNGSDAYFGELANFTRSLDPLRPVTSASNSQPQHDQAARHLDIIGFNRYNGWYQNTGRLDMITENLLHEARIWHERFDKPIMMLEYGADTLEGLHALPSIVWTEDFQCESFGQHFRAFDVLRNDGWFVGEFIWNFADFMTSQKVNRVVGNRKGIFTRQRQPKTVAWLVRQRYHAIAAAEMGTLDGCPVNADKYNYVFENRPQ